MKKFIEGIFIGMAALIVILTVFSSPISRGLDSWRVFLDAQVDHLEARPQ